MTKRVEPDISLPDSVPDEQVQRLQGFVDSLEDRGLVEDSLFSAIDFDRMAFVRAWNRATSNMEHRERSISMNPIVAEIDIVDDATMDLAVTTVLERAINRVPRYYETLATNHIRAHGQWDGIQQPQERKEIRARLRSYFRDILARWEPAPATFEAGYYAGYQDALEMI